jgi:hypothetical protein
MPGFWDTIAGISGDTSVGDTQELIDQAGIDQEKDDDGKSNE